MNVKQIKICFSNDFSYSFCGQPSEACEAFFRIRKSAKVNLPVTLNKGQVTLESKSKHDYIMCFGKLLCDSPSNTLCAALEWVVKRRVNSNSQTDSTRIESMNQCLNCISPCSKLTSSSNPRS